MKGAPKSPSKSPQLKLLKHHTDNVSATEQKEQEGLEQS